MDNNSYSEHIDPEVMSAYVYGGLPPKERAEVEIHITNCDDCRHMLANLAKNIERETLERAYETSAVDRPQTPPPEALEARKRFVWGIVTIILTAAALALYFNYFG